MFKCLWISKYELKIKASTSSFNEPHPISLKKSNFIITKPSHFMIERQLLHNMHPHVFTTPSIYTTVYILEGGFFSFKSVNKVNCATRGTHLISLVAWVLSFFIVSLIVITK